MIERGKSISLYGDTGSGKTTLAGEYAKYVRKTRGKNTAYFLSDLGGVESISPLVRLGVIDLHELGPEDDPWIWIDHAVSGRNPAGESLSDDIGLVVYDSGTSQGEALLDKIKLSNWKIGTQNTQKFKVTHGGQGIDVAANNEAHYGVVQGFLLSAMWKSSWLTRKGIDVLWTFSVHRGENSESEPVIGPKVAGKALTPAMPKWFNYTFRVVSIPVAGSAPRHVLYLQEQPGENGLATSFGNSRYPIDADTLLPATVEPASLVEAFTLIGNGHAEADANIARELGL